MKYRSPWHRFILRSNIRSYWPIIPKDDVHTSNSLQDITQNHWSMKYRSQWPTFILRSCVMSHWFIIPNNDVHRWNSLQGIRHNHWTMKYRSQWPTFILRSNNRSYWFIIPTYDVHTLNSLQDIRQNHWTVKYRSCWPSLHDPNFLISFRNFTLYVAINSAIWTKFIWIVEDYSRNISVKKNLNTCSETAKIANFHFSQVNGNYKLP